MVLTTDRLHPAQTAAAAAAMPQVVDQVALARLYGEPLFSMPHDLYIPPDALEASPGSTWSMWMRSGAAIWNLPPSTC